MDYKKNHKDLINYEDNPIKIDFSKYEIDDNGYIIFPHLYKTLYEKLQSDTSCNEKTKKKYKAWEKKTASILKKRRNYKYIKGEKARINAIALLFEHVVKTSPFPKDSIYNKDIDEERERAFELCIQTLDDLREFVSVVYFHSKKSSFCEKEIKDDPLNALLNRLIGKWLNNRLTEHMVIYEDKTDNMGHFNLKYIIETFEVNPLSNHKRAMFDIALGRIKPAIILYYQQEVYDKKAGKRRLISKLLDGEQPDLVSR